MKRLHELSWVEGRSIAIEYRWSEGHPERIAEIAAEFVRLNVDVILTNDSGAPAVKQATSVIPIVFVLGYDPVGTGLVDSLARPAATSPGCRIALPILPASGSNFCVRLCRRLQRDHPRKCS
jgi:putative ABC transport system substrate-binding protein